jgi:SH3-like domain-containing protein
VIGRRGTTRTARVIMRVAPDPGSASVGPLAPNADVHIMAATGSWFRVQLEDGTAGYVPSASVSVPRASVPRAGVPDAVEDRLRP